MGFDNIRMYRNGFWKSTVEFYDEITEDDEDIFEDEYSSKQREVRDKLLELFQCTDTELDESVDIFNYIILYNTF